MPKKSAFFFELYGAPRDLHVLTHSFPTRRSSDLPVSFEHTGPSPAGCPIRDTLNRLSPLKQGIARERLTSGKGGTDYAGPSSRSDEHTSELQSLMRI